jgi:hypothetical protein
MPMLRFVGMLAHFDKFPPLFEIARAYVTLPGDKGYKIDDNQRRKALRNAVTPSSQPAPEWYRKGADKLARMVKKNG